MSDFEREQRAFREALRAQADAVAFDPIDPDELSLRATIRDAASARVLGVGVTLEPVEDADLGAGSQGEAASATGLRPQGDELTDGQVVPFPRRRWRRDLLALGAAAAALVVVVPLGLNALGGGPTAIPAVAPDTKAAGGYEQNTPTDVGAPQPGPASTTMASGPMASVSPSAAGVGQWRTESMLDVTVKVPATWGYGAAVGADWCANDGKLYPAPTGQPFVALNPLERVMLAIACGGGVPEALQSEHLEWRGAQASDQAGEITENGWVYSSRVVGSVFLTYVHRPGRDAGILATAEQGVVDHHGCPVTAGPSAQRPVPRTLPGPPGSVSLCQYAGKEGPNLITSARLDADAAARLLAQIEAGTVASGPPSDPQNCLNDPADRPTVMLRFEADEVIKEVALLATCGAPTFDDGVTYRLATCTSCAGVFVLPLKRWLWSESTSLCVPPDEALTPPPTSPTPTR